MNIIKNFHVNSVKFDLYFVDFYSATIFEVFKVSTKRAELERINPYVFFFQWFSNNRFFITSSPIIDCIK